MQCDAEPPIVSCRCHFFDGFGEPAGDAVSGAGEHWIDEVLRRRFLRLGMGFLVNSFHIISSFPQFCLRNLSRKSCSWIVSSLEGENEKGGWFYPKKTSFR